MKVILLFISFFLLSSTYATHAVGGNIAYKPTGNLNEYEMTLTVYRDCGGAGLGNTETITIDNICGFASSTVFLIKQSVSEISQVCPAQLPSTECNGGPVSGVEKHVYSATVTLLGACSEWLFSWDLGNRNASTNLVQADSEWFYIESKLNNIDFPNNSSPILTNLFQVPYVCASTPTTLSLFTIDPNGDSLSYSFVNALGQAGVNLVYSPGFSFSQPIPGITIDQNTGSISFSQGIVGNYVITILVEEYSNGQFVGSLMQDYQVIVDFCTNDIPITGNIQNFLNFGTNANYSGNSITACQGDQFCFDIVINDTDIGDIITLTSDAGTVLPGATFTQTGTNPATGTVCWTYDPNYSSTSFSILAQDNSCPIPGSSSAAIYLNLPTPINIAADTLIFCAPGASPLATNSNNQFIQWSDLNGSLLDIGIDISCNPCNTPTFYFTTDTSVIVSTTGNCSVSDTLDIIMNFLPTSFLLDTILVCQNDTATLQSPFPGIINIWNGSIYQDSISLVFSSPTYVNLEIISLGQCVSLDSMYVLPYLPTASIQPGNSGIVTDPFIYYQWIYNNTPIIGANAQVHIPQNNGNYQVFVIDSLGCTDTSDVFIITSASIEKNEISTSIYRANNQIIINDSPINTTFELYDISGKLIEIGLLSEESSIISLPITKQVYIVKLIDKNGELITSKKL